MPRNLVTSFCAKHKEVRVIAKLKNSSLFMFQHIVSSAPQVQFIKEKEEAIGHLLAECNLLQEFRAEYTNLIKEKEDTIKRKSDELAIMKSGPIAHFAGCDLSQMPIPIGVLRNSNVSAYKSTFENAQ